MTGSKVETWVKAGYELLGQEGMEGMRIERLARSLHLNKSGFYYYFGDMNAFIKSLIKYHIGRAKVIGMEIARCENLDPDLLVLIVKHKEFFLVEAQLVVKSRLTHYDEDFDEAGIIVSKKLLPLWKKCRNQPEDAAASLAYLNIIRHFVYARLNPGNINYEFLHTLAVETKDILDKVVTKYRVSSDNKGGPELPA